METPLEAGLDSAVERDEARNQERRPGLLGYIDGILRNREECFNDIFEGRDVPKQTFMLLGITIALLAWYGFVMGTANGFSWYLVSSPVKVPLLFLLTLGVCYPVLYVVNVIMGSRLGFLQTFALILIALALNAILLASCSTIVLFFALTGADYHFLKLMHVGIFAFSGFWAMLGLWRGLIVMCESSNLYPKQAVRILQIWILVFGLVGAQTAWSLRPFIGNPGSKFEVFRNHEGGFYQDVWTSVVGLAEETLDD